MAVGDQYNARENDSVSPSGTSVGGNHMKELGLFILYLMNIQYLSF